MVRIMIAAVYSAAGVMMCMALGCGEAAPWTPPEGETVRFDPLLRAQDGDSEATTWLAYPFPADHRRTASGTLDTLKFPNPDFESTVGLYANYAAENLRGFGESSPIYLSFTSDLDLGSLPTDPTAFASGAAALQLIDVTPSSPEYGMRRPLRWEWFDVDGKFVGPDTLAIAPIWGAPLRQDTTYALVVTRDVASAGGAPLGIPPLVAYLTGALDLAGYQDLTPDALEADLLDALRAQFEPLRTLLGDEAFDVQQIAAATVFTTQIITDELQTLFDTVEAEPSPTVDPNGWQELDGPGVYWETRSFEYNNEGDEVGYYVMEGRYDSPNFVEGDRPYASEFDGGGFHWVDGEPVPTEYETLRFIVAFPAGVAPRNGADCYPIVEYSHGTGGSARSLIGGEAGRHAARGLATIGLDQPLHGTRWGGSGNGSALVLYSFNFLNPAAARTLFRQSAVDTFVLTRLLREGLTIPANRSPTGQPICFDSERISYFGHSHGGLTGSLAAAYQRDVDAWVLSGAGGGIAITVMEREDEYIHAQELLEGVLQLPEGEFLSELHPLVGMIQLLAEITDPINYAPYWNALGDPANVLLTSGEFDEATPYRTAGALAVAARMPQILPLAVEVPEFELTGLAPLAAPASANAHGKTFGFMQWTRGPGEPEDYASHFVVFHRPEAIHATMRFLESTAFEPVPVLERVPTANVK